jgi:hypothetical protein
MPSASASAGVMSLTSSMRGSATSSSQRRAKSRRMNRDDFHLWFDQVRSGTSARKRGRSKESRRYVSLTQR